MPDMNGPEALWQINQPGNLTSRFFPEICGTPDFNQVRNTEKKNISYDNTHFFS